MKADWKIPFKKLEWKSGVTKEGEERGYIYQIGEFYEFRARNPFRKYIITNKAGSKHNNGLSIYNSGNNC